MFLQFEHTDYICPITLRVFRNPVLAPDGYFYEKYALVKWFKNSNKSPLTGLVIDKIMTTSIYFNNMLNNYLIAHPDKLNDQFVEEFNIEVFYRLFKSNKIDELITYMSLYNTFSLPVRDNMDELFKNESIVKILIDKDVCIENPFNQKLIHWICQYSTPEMIKYIIDKGVDLECVNNDGWKPIHFICQYSTPEMIQYIIDKGVDLECRDIIGWRPIHLICRKSTPEMIKYIIDKGVDLECQTNNGWKPIHFICRKSTPEMIKYIINKGVDLECQTNTGWKPIHLICTYSTPEMIKYIIDKRVDINSCVSVYDGKSCNYSVRDIIDIRFKDRNIIDGFTKQDFIQHLIY
jgi:ankyrin repeat protein